MSEVIGLEIRPTCKEDAPYLQEWLAEPETVSAFPVGDPPEIEEAANRWTDFYKQESALTAVYHGAPVGMGILFVQTYERLKHQCMQVLVVSAEYRRLGIGSGLLEELHRLAWERFDIELIHVECYGCPGAVQFYQKRGYVEFARQQRWIKDGETYVERVILERFLPSTHEHWSMHHGGT